jgi:hypothetical protein
MSINQISTANTFQQWLIATQALITTANLLTDGNGQTFVANTILEVSGTGSTLNVRTSAGINVLYANTLVVSGNSTLANATVTYGNFTTANVITLVGSANTAVYANISTAQAAATSAGVYANSSFLRANTPNHVANSAAIYANGAFTAANNATDQSVAFAIALG